MVVFFGNMLLTFHGLMCQHSSNILGYCTVHLYNCKQTIIKAKGNYLLCMYENAKVKVNHSALPRVKFTYKVIFPAPRMIIGS